MKLNKVIKEQLVESIIKDSKNNKKLIKLQEKIDKQVLKVAIESAGGQNKIDELIKLEQEVIDKLKTVGLNKEQIFTRVVDVNIYGLDYCVRFNKVSNNKILIVGSYYVSLELSKYNTYKPSQKKLIDMAKEKCELMQDIRQAKDALNDIMCNVKTDKQLREQYPDLWKYIPSSQVQDVSSICKLLGNK